MRYAINTRYSCSETALAAVRSIDASDSEPFQRVQFSSLNKKRRIPSREPALRFYALFPSLRIIIVFVIIIVVIVIAIILDLYRHKTILELGFKFKDAPRTFVVKL